MKLSIVVPVYNAADVLESSVDVIVRSVDIPKRDYEIIIAEDGSVDGSDRIASDLCERFGNVRCVSSRRRKGKGRAIKDAFRVARGDFVAFMDVDLSSDMRYLTKLLKSLGSGADIAIGSRNMPGSDVERGAVRGVASRAYNMLVRTMFDTSITDFQCGFKAFRRSALPLAFSAKNDGFFWDTEVLLLAERKGMRIDQVPIRWKTFRKTKVRLMFDSMRMLFSLLSLRAELLFAFD